MRRNEIMNYAERIADKLKECPECAGVAPTVVTVQKGRAICTQLSMSLPGGTASVNVTIDDFFGKGTSIDEAARTIAGIIHQQSKENGMIDILQQHLMDFEAVKTELFIRLYNLEDYERESGAVNTLADIPGKKVAEDLIAVCYVDIVDKDEGSYTTNVTKNLLKAWGKTFEEVFSVAQKNMGEISDFRAMNEVLCEILTEFYTSTGFSEKEARKRALQEIGTQSNPMYVLTAKNKVFGAGMLAVPDVLGKFFQKDEWVILPSSVHEVIAIPAGDLPIEDCKEMVQKVNQNEVDPTDQLSDSVYVYRQGELVRF